MPVKYELLTVDPTGARAGVLHTRRGPVQTPVFMPVATHATIRGMDPGEVWSTGARVLLSNTYHLMLRPGPEVFRKHGGIHRFMDWEGVVLTDSGGFQIFSLPEDRQITEKGAHFRSFYDNSRQLLSPETSIAMQQAIGSDIMMVLDVCIDSTSDEPTTLDAMERTHRWALRSLEQRDREDTGQALFAIVQGGVFPHLRDASADFLTRHPFDGFAVGGLAVGETKDELHTMTERVTSPAADGEGPLPDGGGHADRSAGVRAPRHRHVRLHHPHEDGAAGLCLHLPGAGPRDPSGLPPLRGAAGRHLRLQGLQALHAQLSAAPHEGAAPPGRAADGGPQRAALPGAHGPHARRRSSAGRFDALYQELKEAYASTRQR